jgi:glycosyltransferase involved in cell wall biosynthesis
MRVLFINPYISTAYGGISKIVLELVAALGEQGVHVDLITTNAHVHKKLDVPLNKWVQKDGYRIRYFSCWNTNDFILSKAMLSWLYKNVSIYHVVHTHTVFSPLISFCQWVCSLHKVPYVVTPHGMLEPWALGYKFRKKNIYFNLLERRNISRSALIQGTASVELENISRLFPHSNAQLVPNGISLSQSLGDFGTKIDCLERYPELNNKRLILFLGRIDPKKGLDLLASAFEQVRRHTPDTHLIVAGPDNIGYLSQAKQYFAEASCLEAVTFTGMLTGEMKACALELAEVYVSPSYSEGFSMSVLEGMAAGLPCVITTGCNFPEAQENTAAYVVDIDANAIAMALSHCLQNPQEAKAVGERARQFIRQNYTWESIATRLIQSYAEILQPEAPTQPLLML